MPFRVGRLRSPVDLGRSKACGFCGTALNDGSGDWVLEDVGPHNVINDLMRDHLTPSGAEERVDRMEADRFLNGPELLTAMSRILTVDGELHQKEREHIIALAESRGVSRKRLKSIFATATASDTPIIVPKGLEQANAFMDHLLRAALIDGRVTRSEHALLVNVGRQLGWSPADLRIALARVRGELFQQARQVIRNRKRRQR